MIHADYYRLAKKQKRLLQRKNKIDYTFYNGIYQRYLYPVLTNDHVPLHWRYDLSMTENPYLIERLGINSVFNPGAIFHEGSYYLMARVEGTDRKSFFAIAKSTTGIDRFEFIDQPVLWDKALADEVNMYDIRLVKHQDGAIYGTYTRRKTRPILLVAWLLPERPCKNLRSQTLGNDRVIKKSQSTTKYGSSS